MRSGAGGSADESVVDGRARDQPGAAAEGEVEESPLDKDENTALELDDIQEVNEKPDEPSGQTGDMEAEDVGNRGGAANHGKVAFVEVAEGGRGRLTADASRSAATSRGGREAAMLSASSRKAGRATLSRPAVKDCSGKAVR